MSRSTRTKNCQQCGEAFTYEVGRGLDRKHCGKRCQRAHFLASRLERVGNCCIRNCTKKATRADGLCETHWYRRYRNGTTADPTYKHFYLATNGYYLAFDKGHPVARDNGTLFMHRKVLWDSIGEGPHKCHWCKQEIDWKFAKGPQRLVVDHVDGNKHNNDLSNLVPACHVCNVSRGSFMNWAKRHRNDPFLIALFFQATEEAA